ncbi:MAG: hypothetical protein LBI10_06110 [Deltaproteobacteria bacterium]|jgi:hypothetical protein|nr:hypothetical protein [Deltaproteobacteria bacterium]
MSKTTWEEVWENDGYPFEYVAVSARLMKMAELKGEQKVKIALVKKLFEDKQDLSFIKRLVEVDDEWIEAHRSEIEPS